jgi:hypothetical protein
MMFVINNVGTMERLAMQTIDEMARDAPEKDNK